jgi:subtilisin family serine protease
MKGSLRFWLAPLLGLAAAGLVRAAPDPGARPPADPSRQILVMLRLPPSHLRPGSDYAGGYDDAMGGSARRRVAEGLARAHGLTLAESWPMSLVGVDCFVLDIPPGASPEALAASLSREPQVAWSQPMNLYRTQAAAAPNDPLYRAQPAAREWRLAELHRFATGAGVRVAVVDSAVEAGHPDLAGQIAVSRNFVAGRTVVSEQHGTNVAGIIAAKADNGLGMAGVAPGARLLALRACWQMGGPAGQSGATVCDSLSLAKAISFAITHDAQVINLSLSGRTDRLLGALIDVAGQRRISVVAAYDRGLPGGGFPASHAGVVAVADETAGAPPPEVYAAPGRDVPTTQPGGRWGLVSGASFAAAHVSGLLALMRQRRAGGGVALVAFRPGGAVDACASLARAVGPGPCAATNTAVVRR